MEPIVSFLNATKLARKPILKHAYLIPVQQFSRFSAFLICHAPYFIILGDLLFFFISLIISLNSYYIILNIA